MVKAFVPGHGHEDLETFVCCILTACDIGIVLEDLSDTLKTF